MGYRNTCSLNWAPCKYWHRLITLLVFGYHWFHPLVHFGPAGQSFQRMLSVRRVCSLPRSLQAVRWIHYVNIDAGCYQNFNRVVLLPLCFSSRPHNPSMVALECLLFTFISCLLATHSNKQPACTISFEVVQLMMDATSSIQMRLYSLKVGHRPNPGITFYPVHTAYVSRSFNL